ncbi:MAG: NACHT domain-containing protein [Rhizobiaceae bacterium]
MDALVLLREQIETLLGPAPLNLFDAIAAVAKETEGDKAFAEKAAVMARLKASEGVQPAANTLSQRLVQINAATKAQKVDFRSRKAGFEIRFAPGAIGSAVRERTRAAIARSTEADTQLPEGFLQQPRATRLLPTYSVFISHAWESKENEAKVDAFVEMLEHKLHFLPPKHADRFAIRLYFDRKDMHGRSTTFEGQTDPACRGAHLAIFLLSDKWYSSPGCRSEAEHFKTDGVLDGARVIKIQTSGRRSDGDSAIVGGPVYPELWKPTRKTLLDLFTNGRQTERQAFVERIRDDILAALEKAGPPEGGAPAPGGRGGRIRASKPIPPATPLERFRALAGDHERHELIVQTGTMEAPHVTETEGGGEPRTILPMLEQWANSAKVPNRLFVLLGSFGSGKTTASQMLAHRLTVKRKKNRKAPFPVYLDFRRLNDAYDGNTTPPLRDIIVRSMAPDIAALLDADSVMKMLREEPCVVIFDGLDEIGTRIGPERAGQLYRQLLELVPRAAWNADYSAGEPDWKACPTRLLVTCRTHFFRSHIEEESTLSARDRQLPLPGAFAKPRIATWYMAPFTPEQIRSFFVKTLGEEAGNRAHAAIAQVADLADLAKKPIMTRYIAELAPQLVKDHEAGKPINAASVYRHLFDRALERDKDKRMLLTPDDRLKLLEKLALRFWTARKPVLPIGELEQWFDAYAVDDPGILFVAMSAGKEARDLLHVELRNASLLVRGHDDGFGFVHTSFGEYFLAGGLLKALLADELPAVENLPPVSNEALAFLLDRTELDGAQTRLAEALDRVLLSEAEVAVRQLALAVRDAAIHRWFWRPLPAGANLSGLDLRNIVFGVMSSTLDGVRFDDANLFRSRFAQVTFSGCSFGGAMLAQTQFDRCRFSNCHGVPREMESAVLFQPELDAASQPLFARVRFRFAAEPQPNRDGLHLNIGHWSIVTSAAFSPDGRTVLTGSGDNTARLWEAATGKELCRFKGHGDSVIAVAFSPDGRTVLTGSDDNTARLWEAATGKELRRFEGHDGSVTAAAFSPDGRTVLTGSGDKTARLWEAATGRCQRIMLVLEDSWATLNPDLTVESTGPNAWKYVHALREGDDGLPMAVTPEHAP